MFFSKNNKGFGLIEAIIGVAMGSLLLLVFMTLITQTMEVNRENSNQLKAAMYLQELIEIARDLERDPAWTELSKTCTLAAPCHPEPDGSNWELENSPEAPLGGIFTRGFIIDPVSRNGYDIESVYNPTNDDPDTKKITARITWGNSLERKLETYVYKY